jgi:acyl-CoA reductase-like NAD-dependent aldehyde dehydrogenase
MLGHDNRDAGLKAGEPESPRAGKPEKAQRKAMKIVTSLSDAGGTSVASQPAVARVLAGGEELEAPAAPVINPARVTEVVGSYALGTARHVDLAVRAAVAAFPAWSALPAAARGEQLLRAADEMTEHVPGWAETLTREVGKVLPESRGDAPDAPLVTAEQFGPVIPVLPFAGEDEAVALANDTEFGLAASGWSADTERAWRLARRLQAGSVLVNVHRVGASPMSLPFGGFKQRGVGRNHGLESVLACMEQQAVVEFDDPAALPGTDHWRALS